MEEKKSIVEEKKPIVDEKEEKKSMVEEKKPKDILIIEPPNELHFAGPFTQQVVTTLRLSNPSDALILYKIKTTAPKQYCVRPNFGTVLPNTTTVVEICLQPFTYNPSMKNKHKFMVQSLIAPLGCKDTTALWKEKEGKDLMDAKLRCVFDCVEEDYGGAKLEPIINAAPAEIIKDSQSKLMGDVKISNLQTSDQTESFLAEIRQLREENVGLRKENMNLKDQVIRFRCSSAVKPPMDEPYTPLMAEKQIPMLYIAIAIAAAIFGLLFGKYFL